MLAALPAFFAATRLALSPVVEELYLRVGTPLIFSDGVTLNAAGTQLVGEIREADMVGLDPRDYHVAQVEALLIENDLPELDPVLADAMLLMAVHRSGGRLDRETLGRRRLSPDDVETLLAWAIEAVARPAKALSALDRGLDRAPLVEALGRHRALEMIGGWPALSLAERLAISGDLEAGDDLVLGIVSFQARHALPQTGWMDDATQEQLAIPIRRQVEQLAINIEQRRWLGELGSRFLIVNVAGANLSLFDSREEAMSMRVVVGRSDRRTPIFSTAIGKLILNPAWNVPRKLAIADVLPEAQKDVRYLIERKIRVLDGRGAEVDPRSIDWASLGPSRFPYRFRQDPGPRNPLGRIKFMLPNRNGVQMHDTPAKSLFLETERCASSGCIRVERPIELAVALLADDAWTAERLQAAIDSGATQTLVLLQPMPVHIVYWTSWIDGDGSLQIRRDVYGRDRAVGRALADRKRSRIILSGMPES